MPEVVGFIHGFSDDGKTFLSGLADFLNFSAIVHARFGTVSTIKNYQYDQTSRRFWVTAGGADRK